MAFSSDKGYEVYSLESLSGINVNEWIHFMFTLILGYEGPFTVVALRFSIDRFQMPNQNICQLNNILNVYCIDGSAELIPKME